MPPMLGRFFAYITYNATHQVWLKRTLGKHASATPEENFLVVVIKMTQPAHELQGILEVQSQR